MTGNQAGSQSEPDLIAPRSSTLASGMVCVHLTLIPVLIHGIAMFYRFLLIMANRATERFYRYFYYIIITQSEMYSLSYDNSHVFYACLWLII